jgi:transcriptional regulator with XRE-family HTH domain
LARAFFSFFYYHQPMPTALVKKSKLPPLEVAICLRVREIREGARMNQQTFADAISTNRARLSNLEYALAPLRFELAERLCAQFDINWRWMATGDGPKRPHLEAKAELVNKIGGRTLFSLAYSKHLKAYTEDWWATVAVRFPNSKTLSNRRQIWPEENFPQLLAMTQADLKNAQSLMRQAEVADSDFKRKALLDEAGLLLASAIERDGAVERSCRPDVKVFFAESKAAKQLLTDAETLDKSLVVKSQLPTLLERLKKATSETGKKSELAEFLAKVTKSSVPLASVSRWLSGEREPGGEIALLMLRWVELQERKT